MAKRTVELAPYESNEIDVRVEQATYTVREIKVKELSDFLRVTVPIVEAFEEGEMLGKRRSGEITLPPERYALYTALATHTEAFIAAVVLCSNVPRSVLERMPPHYLFEFAAAMLEVNASFFVRALAPSLRRMLDVLIMLGAGATLFNNLSQPGIATTISSNTDSASTKVTETPPPGSTALPESGT